MMISTKVTDPKAYEILALYCFLHLLNDEESLPLFQNTQKLHVLVKCHERKHDVISALLIYVTDCE